MKKSLLMTTALVALVSASNAYAETIIDSSDNNWSNEYGETGYQVSSPADIADTNLIVNGTDIYFTDASGSFSVSEGDELELNDGRIHADNLNNSVKISGGKITAIGNPESINEAGIWANNVEISGGEINLQNGMI